jgi:hypothetical protein
MKARGLIITIVVAVATFIILVTGNYYLLWKPSLEGKCGGQKLGAPAPPLPHLVRFRGQVVGKNLWIIQYRWLRRRFVAVGTKLSLIRDLPTTEYQGNVVLQGEAAGDVVINKSGRFDFGDPPPGRYNLKVTFIAVRVRYRPFYMQRRCVGRGIACI